jgi:hypothetical protein
MCCGPYDYDYPTYGGKHERIDRTYGRVGSLFSDPQASYDGELADSNWKSPDSKRNSESDDGGTSEESDADIERFKKELESITPKEQPGLNFENNLEELPQPDSTNDPTAMGQPRGQQQRSQWQWR